MKSFRLNRVIFSACAIVLGIVLLIWPERSLFIISKCIGVFLAGGGLAAAYMYYRDHDSAVRSVLLVLAAVMLICGAVIFMHPEELIKLIPTIVGILVMISGLINIGETFILSRSKYGRWWISLIIAIITIAAGIFIINKAFSLAAFITRIAGGVLIFDGLTDLWVVSRLYKASKDAEIEVSAVEVNTAAAGTEGTETPSPQAAPAGGGAEAPQNTSADSAAAAPQNAPAEQYAQEPVTNTVTGADAPASGNGSQAPSEKDAGNPAGTVGNTSLSGTDIHSDVPEYMKQAEQNTDYSSYEDKKSSDGDIPDGEWKPIE